MNTTSQEGPVPQRQAPPPPRTSTSSSNRTSTQASPRSQPLKMVPPPPQKPSHSSSYNIGYSSISSNSSGNSNTYSTRLNTPHDSLRSNHSDNTLSLTSQSSSPKSSRSSNFDGSDYPSSRTTFKGVFSNLVNSWTDLLSSDKKIEISSPYNPVHLTHVGYNLDTGEFTGLPKEWQQLLQESGISKQDQAAHPQAVIDIIGFYTDSQKGKQNDAVWKKFGHTVEPAKTSKPSVPPEQHISPEHNRPTQAPPPLAPRPVFDSSRLPPNPPPAKKPPITQPKEVTPGDKQELPDDEPVAEPTPISPPPPKAPPPKPKKTPHHQGTTAAPPPKPSHGAPSAPTGATPRLREKKADKDAVSSQEVIRRLQAICTDADPTKLYRNLVKVGQGASGGVYTAYQVGTNLSVAIKQMNLEQQPKKDLIINEILVMKESSHKNIVNYIDSFLYRGDLWVVMEYMEGGSLTEVVTTNEMADPQIGAVCRETLLGLEHLHSKGVIHRDIKSDNVLLSLNGDIKL
ncbi:signal transducing kinase of the PAK, partial [Mortierella sp. NVP85]